MVFHTYIPSQEWPLELFERVIEVMRRLAIPSNKDDFAILSQQWSVGTISNYAQVSILSGGNADYYCAILGNRCIYKHHEQSKLCIDAAGNASFCFLVLQL